MRTIDLSPLYRASVGFDRMASVMDTLMASDAQVGGYPPYNIEKTGESDYRITLAVAGFGEDEISVETKGGELVISGAKAPRDESADNERVLHRGIAERSFERRFKLADHVRATDAKLENGLLHVDLVREVPEELKPRRIAIQSGGRDKAIAAE